VLAVCICIQPGDAHGANRYCAVRASVLHARTPHITGCKSCERSSSTPLTFQAHDGFHLVYQYTGCFRGAVWRSIR
jgi:hypothetical protein